MPEATRIKLLQLINALHEINSAQIAILLSEKTDFDVDEVKEILQEGAVEWERISLRV